MARRPVLEFWYEFASTYSYLAAMRIEPLAEAAGVDIRWRPFLLGPIFAAQGWNSSPFNLFPAKGRYMWRDMQREGARLGLPVHKSETFPQNSLVAARVALLGAEHPWGPTFTKAVYHRAFGEGRSIAEPAAVQGILTHLGMDADGVLRAASADANKTRLKALTEEARSRGIFGAPTFFTEDGEMFWGNDRLEQALAWASGERTALAGGG
ncbi:MAG TPA: 2-hydroxychromene-2-carboxylate isomerase [Beijerinckiaceae bacterium]|jgi:2-hydroxychromene-2-carboxylate isomerase